jgi:hypothetical protein
MLTLSIPNENELIIFNFSYNKVYNISILYQIIMITKNNIELYKKNIYKHLHETVIEFFLLEKGACNNIYLFKTFTGKLYCLKEERFDKLDREKNNILKEATLINFLHNKSIKYTPRILFILKKYKAYCYEYIKGDSTPRYESS